MAYLSGPAASKRGEECICRGRGHRCGVILDIARAQLLRERLAVPEMLRPVE